SFRGTTRPCGTISYLVLPIGLCCIMVSPDPLGLQMAFSASLVFRFTPSPYLATRGSARGRHDLSQKDHRGGSSLLYKSHHHSSNPPPATLPRVSDLLLSERLRRGADDGPSASPSIRRRAWRVPESFPAPHW